jgi:hypothetical protein
MAKINEKKKVRLSTAKMANHLSVLTSKHPYSGPAGKNQLSIVNMGSKNVCVDLTYAKMKIQNKKE